ncbi:receptor-type tyrosine-protein phosphatase mu-like [Gigantopelta aegis]|uniref:receptor-type tyrosine-protein phosphatase mu-like n=1 Tax=Gigantopelta aegis TaxID=1735272 RepID=UPI001B88B0A0|nr:receptor-type tyrosine-protein phosphatase mu-like [Gigantopelta aegis]
MTCDRTARYITLYRNDSSNEDTAMNFCEVQIFVCDAGTFGDDCRQFCHCLNGPCNYVTGECTGGCKPNWTGTTCSECDSKHYGPLCGKPCYGRHCDESRGKSSCDRKSGLCVDGCSAGWKGPDCTQECDYGRYGLSCGKSCNSRHCDESHGKSSCDKQTGRCDNGCAAGWKEPDCTKECDSDHYGPLCAKSCFKRHCDESRGKSSCNKVTGRCDNGCTAGWKKPDCTKECANFTYGLQCANICSKRKCFGTSSCDHVTGKSDNGCDRGYQSEDCTAMCPSGKYSYNCNMSCEERECAGNSTCDRYNGTCESGCLKGWELPDCITSIAQTAAPNEHSGPIIGGVFGTAVVVVVVAVIIFVFLRRRKQAKDDTTAGEPIVPENKPSTKERTHHAPDVSTYVNVELSSTNSAKRFEVNETFASDEITAVNTGEVRLVVDQEESEVQQPDEDEEDIQDPNTYYNDVQPAAPSFILPEEGFDVTELRGIIESIREQPGGFHAEYLKLPSGFSHPYNDSQIPENRCKNRYAGYYPYDNNRVKLSALPNTPHSDYINASYVDAYEKPNYFIAAQAPNSVTLPDFWRMIWEQDCVQIIMLTNLVEAGKHKCVPYWRDSGSMEVGYVEVVVKDVTERADYIIRKIQITQTKSKKCKTFDHYHFTSWPDHGVPKVLDLVEFFWLTRDTPPSRPGPVLVHCR